MRILLACLILIGCYEGWEYGNGPGVGNTIPTDPDVPVIKPLQYILLESFRLSDAAIDDTGCFPNVGLKDFRKNEWNERLLSMTAAFQSIADTFVSTERRISTGDCASFTSIFQASADSAPWDPQPSPELVTSNKAIVHVKAVLWDEDQAVDPDSLIVREHWNAWQDLWNSGRNAVSVFHFVLGSATDGHMRNWQNQVPANIRQDGTGIMGSDVDPTAQGIASRSATIANDTEALTAFILTLTGN